ncbi:FAD-binding oxidoreductase [Tianweitania populi]|uniref:Oxidoreductase n=1 Tax=Tianweitania populi TaxID=1607949 RepID=A0A8J3DUR3_9HYPH|nr:FAD-binding oxidoreductase [Tianweitania populi]GHD22373.1 oxidoreductase [Tianweitania populi]
MTPEKSSDFVAYLRAHLDANAFVEGANVNPASVSDGTRVSGFLPSLLLRPRNAADLSLILQTATKLRQSVVIQGGLTGLAGGARPRHGEVAVSLERMRGMSAVNVAEGTIEVEAGVPLQAVQEAAQAAGFMFGVDLGARGSASIGGMIATNAGGIRVLRYGMMRDQVAGLEGVLADGTVIDSMLGLPKDNAGYDLRQLLVGSEGTLGVVTRAKLRLRPAPKSERAALLSLGSVDDAIKLLVFLRERIGDLLAAFEIIFPDVYAGTIAHMGIVPPLPPGAGLYVLTDIQGQTPDADLERFQAALGDAVEIGLCSDAILSSSGREFETLWAIRDGVSDCVYAQGQSYGFDIGVPLNAINRFLKLAADRVSAIDPTARAFIFGHLGDGNLHYIVETEEGADIAKAVLTAVAEAGGTITAEHGIGTDKRDWLHLCRSEAELAVMGRLKRALDPAGILNPERVISTSAAYGNKTLLP